MEGNNGSTTGRIAPDVKLGRDVKVYAFVNLYGCEIGDESRVGTFVEIQKKAVIGKRCKISSHTFVCEGVVIEDEVFVGHGVMFINDRDPRAANADGSPQTEADWVVVPTRVCKQASIGSGAVIMCGVTIGEGALVGAGAVVTRDVPAGTVVVGNPARVLRRRIQDKEGVSDVPGTDERRGYDGNGGGSEGSGGRVPGRPGAVYGFEGAVRDGADGDHQGTV